MNVSAVVCPCCKGNNSIQSVPAIVSSSTSNGSFSGISGGVVNIDNQIGYNINRVNLNGTMVSDLARQLSRPEKPEIYKASSGGIILGIILFIFLWPSVFFIAYNYFKRKKESKLRFEYLYPKWPRAFDKWKSSFYCHRCGIVFDPKTNEYCNPNDFDAFLDYQY